MPTYVYRCLKCGLTFERQQKMSDAPLTDCPECEGKVRRVIQPVPIVFRGPGFYVTDHGGRTSASTTPGNGEKPTEAPKAEPSTTKANSSD